MIGQRFELNDKQVSIIGELLPKAAASSAATSSASSQGQAPVKKKIIIRPNRQ